MIAMDIRTGDVLDGSFPLKDKSLVEALVLEYQDELLSMWSTQEFTRLDSIE